MKFTFIASMALVLALSSCSSNLSTEEYLQRGSNYMDQKEWKSAIIEYKNGVKLSPNNAQARLLLGKAYLQTRSSGAAIKELTKAVEMGIDKDIVLVALGKAYAQHQENDKIIAEITINDNLSVDDTLSILALRANSFIQKDMPKEALDELNKAKAINSDHTDVRLSWANYEGRYGTADKRLEWLKPLFALDIPGAWSQMGEMNRVNGKLKEAEENYTKAIELRGFVHADILSRALVRLSQQKFNEAKSDIQLLKKAGISTPVTIHSEGVIAFYQKDLDLAQSKFDEVLGKYKSFPPSVFYLGLTYYQKKNFESAISLLSQYLKENSGNKQARFVLSLSLLQSNKLPQAIVELEELYKVDATNEKVLSLLGGAYLRNGQLSEGVSLFKKSASLNPNLASAQLQLGSVLIRDKKTAKQGQQALMKALDLDPSLFQANLSLYLSYMQQKNFNEAEKVAQKMVDSNEEDSLAYNLIASVYQARGDVDKAVNYFETTLEKFPSDPLTSNNLAKIKLQKNQIEDAKRIYLKVIEKHPADLRSLINLAVIEAKLGEQDKKIEYLKAAVDLNPSVLSPKLLLATEYLKSKSFKEALAVLKEANEEDAKKIEVQLINVKAKMGLKEYDYALVILKKLIAQNPKSSSSYFLLGQNFGYLKQKTNMKAAFEQVLKLKPDHFSASLILTRLALLEGDKETFEKNIKKLLPLYPDNAEVKFLHAKLSNQEKDYQSAISSLESLLDDTPSSEVIIDLARNKWASGDKDGAISGVELWIEGHPDDKKALFLLAQFYIDQNRFEDANRTYEKVDKLLPNNAIVLNNMAWLYRESNIKQGITLARKALALEPENPYIKDTLAMLLLGDNNTGEAFKYSSEAAEALPNFVEVQLNFVKVLIASDKKEEANDLLNKLNLKVKSFDQRQQINTLLNSL